MKIENYVRDIQDFSKEGILFKDITPLLNDVEARQECLSVLVSSLNGQKLIR